MARKKKHPEHVNHEAWLVSYADFITLLFAFFVVMFAVSQVDSAKLGRFVESVKEATNQPGLLDSAGASIIGKGGGYSTSIIDLDLKGALGPGKGGEPTKRRRRKSADGDGGIESSLPKGALPPVLQVLAVDPELAGRVALRVEARGSVVSLLEVGFFGPASANIRSDALPLLRRIGETLRDTDRPVRLEGHADDRPIRTARFPSNWELSAERALTVLRYFESELGFESGRLSAGLYGEHAPLGDNSTSEGRARNRRVDIVLLSEDARRLEPVTASLEAAQARESSTEDEGVKSAGADGETVAHGDALDAHGTHDEAGSGTHGDAHGPHDAGSGEHGHGGEASPKEKPIESPAPGAEEHGHAHAAGDSHATPSTGPATAGHERPEEPSTSADAEAQDHPPEHEHGSHS